MLGQVIAHYRIVEKLGEGGMGVVYKAEDLKLRRMVALKFFPAKAMGDQEAKERFVREAQAAAALEHPNICTVHDLEEAEGHTFMVMTYVEGASLHHRMQAAPMSLAECLDIATQIGEGLKAAHAKGIVHRDIKPANILITRDGTAKISDFGLALLLDRSRITKTGAVMGTVSYMAPEQALGKRVDRRVDIWSLGVVLYEMISGRTPFQTAQPQSILYRIVKEEPAPPGRPGADLPAELVRILSKALAKSPDERYQHVDDMVVDLRAVRRQADQLPQVALPSTVTAGHAAVSETDPTRTMFASESAQAPEPPGRRSWLIVLFGILVLVGVLFAWMKFLAG